MFLQPSGRAGIVFARDASGKRPTQKLVASVEVANTIVRDYKLAKVLTPIVAWLANFLPRKSSSAALPAAVSRSGVRAKPGARKVGEK